MLWQRQPPSRGTEWAKQSGDSQAPNNEYETSRILSVGDRVSSHVPVGLAADASTSYTYDTVIDTTSIQVNKRFSVDCTNALRPLCQSYAATPRPSQPRRAKLRQHRRGPARQPPLRKCVWDRGGVRAPGLPAGRGLGGNCTYNAAEQNDKLMAAARDFAGCDPDEKADITLMTETAMGGLLDTGPEPATGIFSSFTDGVPLVQNPTKRSYAKLLTGNNWALLRGDYIGTQSRLLPSKKHGVDTTTASGSPRISTRSIAPCRTRTRASHGALPTSRPWEALCSNVY
ncbi:FAD binding domain-containing protein [Apiospora arundinis]|uniref:FAD binding domain-containing protein n=1 Tax=Apiospora arundinis TaxID=335852 RepID=A0ABR2J2Z9_9PEZI